MYGDANFINQVPLFSGLDEAQQVSLQQKKETKPKQNFFTMN